jgi:hypothetical protein
MLCDCICCFYLFVSSPSSSPIAPETEAAQETDDTPDDSSFAAELPGKQPSLDACLYRLFLLPLACIRIAAVTALFT